jgi:hypothetical protein
MTVRWNADPVNDAERNAGRGAAQKGAASAFDMGQYDHEPMVAELIIKGDRRDLSVPFAG